MRLSQISEDYPSLFKIIEMNYDFLEEVGVNIEEPYGCGSYGCAFATEDPYITAKITADALELTYYTFCREYNSPIFPAIFYIEKLDSPDNWSPNKKPFYLVLREAVEVIEYEDLSEEIMDEVSRYILIEKSKVERDIRDDDREVNLGMKYCPNIGDDHLDNIGISKLRGLPILFDAWMIYTDEYRLSEKYKHWLGDK